MIIYDSDSHILEPIGWLEQYADPSIREDLRPSSAEVPLTIEQSLEVTAGRRSFVESGREVSGHLFGRAYDAIGAFDSWERSRALDFVGIQAQLVLPTVSPDQFMKSTDLNVVYGGARALNRAICDFCSRDSRLLPVSWVPFHDPELALAETLQSINDGCNAIHVPSHVNGISPSHSNFDPLWRTLEESEIPFLTHFGGGGDLVPSSYLVDGVTSSKNWVGDNKEAFIRAKDFLGIHLWPQWLLSVLVIDGVFERFPLLKGGVWSRVRSGLSPLCAA